MGKRIKVYDIGLLLCVCVCVCVWCLRIVHIEFVSKQELFCCT